MEQIYRCSYCPKTYKTEDACLKHEAKCKISYDKRQEEKQAKLEATKQRKAGKQAIQNAKNIPEMITLLTEYYAKKNILIDFDSYPDIFSTNISNTYFAPTGYPQNYDETSDKPKGYPGWTGQWKGTIRALSKEFSDICNDFLFLKAGNGRLGKKFDISGKLFLYDFPNMKESFEKSKGYHKMLQAKYKQETDEYLKKYKSVRNDFVDNQEDIKKIEKIKEESLVLYNAATQALAEHKEYYANEFNKINDMETPINESIFTSTKIEQTALIKIKDIICKSYNFLEGFKRIEELQNEMKTFKKKYPEALLL